MERSHNRAVDLWYTVCVIGGTAASLGFSLAWLGFQLLGAQGGEMRHAPVVVPLAAALVGLLIGPLLWWRQISKSPVLDVRQGARTGALCGLLAHPLMWWLVTLFYVFTNIDHVAVSWGVALLAVGLLALPLASLIVLGWLTALLGATAGAMLVLTQRQLQRLAGGRIAS